MGQKKSVDKNESKIDEQTLDKFIKVLQSIVGHYMQLTISTSKAKDDSWEALGDMKLGSTLDGKHWGEMNMSVKGYDVNSDSALATIMVSLNNYINSPEFVVEIGQRMLKSLDGDANPPSALAGQATKVDEQG